ncbi:MAG: hypothetical protein V5789_13290 [Colwellia sp.]
MSACMPVSEDNEINTASELIPQCIGSQSQCEISFEGNSESDGEANAKGYEEGIKADNSDVVRFSLKFSQHHLSDKIKTERPFTIELSQLKNNSVSSLTKVTAYLEGKDMFMGKVPVFFQQKGQSNVYLAQSLLASCSEEEMVWRLWVTIDKNGEAKTFFVDFTSQRL